MSTPQTDQSGERDSSHSHTSRPDRLPSRRRVHTLFVVALVAAVAVIASCTVERAESVVSPSSGSEVEQVDTPTGDIPEVGDCPFTSLYGGSGPDGRDFAQPEAVANQTGDLVIPEVVAVGASGVDYDLTSFDDTQIRLHWFPHPEAAQADPMPTVLMGPGWSLGGDTSDAGLGLFGGVSIATLREAGFNVLTWDPRGFGESDGAAQVNSFEFEARDVQLILNWLSTQDAVQLDQPGDPRVGMVGVSYGGGIQLAVASQDCRVDALVPSLAWNSLPRSLYQSELMKSGWAGVLVNTAIMGTIDKHIHDSYREGRVSGVLSEENSTWFESRGPSRLVSNISAPTLLIQGTTDTLFTLNESLDNFDLLHQAGTPVAMLWFCGGHGFCLTNEDDDQRLSDATISWLKWYLLNDTSSALDWVLNVVDQHGNSYLSSSADSVTAKLNAQPLTWNGDGGRLTLQRTGGSGPTQVRPPAMDIMYALVQAITPGPADNAVDMELPMDAAGNGQDDNGETLLLGAPKLSFTYRGTSTSTSPSDTDPERPTHVFAQLVDPETGIVLGNQITPIPLTLDDTDREVSLDLEAISHLVAPTDTLMLQLVANTVAYADPQRTGSVEFFDVELTIPVAQDFVRQ